MLFLLRTIPWLPATDETHLTITQRLLRWVSIMPANLTAEAKSWMARYREARTTAERIAALEKAHSAVPKHKGTEKLCAQMKRKLSQLRREAAEKKGRRTGGERFALRKEGAAQVAILGAANSGKSQLLTAMTNAKTLVAGYPLTTKKPVPGMLALDGVEVQLVEAPAPVLPGGGETPFFSRSLGLAKNADALVLVVDGCSDPGEQLRRILEAMDEAGMTLRPRTSEISVEKASSGGIRMVVMGSFRGTLDEARRLLRDVGIHHAVVRVWGTAEIGDLEEALVREVSFKKGLVVINKKDVAPRAAVDEAISLARQLNLPLVAVSALKREGLDALSERLFDLVGFIRVFTMKDGAASEKPLVTPIGSTVQDVANVIHRELAGGLRYARVWGRSARFPGQRVGRNHVLQTDDVVELVWRKSRGPGK